MLRVPMRAPWGRASRGMVIVDLLAFARLLAEHSNLAYSSSGLVEYCQA